MIKYISLFCLLTVSSVAFADVDCKFSPGNGNNAALDLSKVSPIDSQILGCPMLIAVGLKEDPKSSVVINLSKSRQLDELATTLMTTCTYSNNLYEVSCTKTYVK